MGLHDHIKMVKCFLESKSPPHEFWGELVYTIVYLLKRSPTNCFEDIIPMKLGYGVNLDWSIKISRTLSHFKILGTQLKKLDDKRKSMKQPLKAIEFMLPLMATPMSLKM